MAKIKLVGPILDSEAATIYSWWGFDSISAKVLERAIKGLSDGEELEIDLNSQGGYCSVGAEIYTMLRQASKEGHKVTVNVVGQACSAATVLMCGADEVVGSPVAFFMFHNSSVSASGKSRDLRSATESLEQIDETIVNAYEQKTGHSREELHNLIDAETWMSVNRAMEYGFVDRIMFEKDTEEDKTTEGENPEEDALIFDMVKACATSHMIADDKLSLMRDVMIKEMAKEKGGNAESIDINKKKEGGHERMTLEEIYGKHPEVKDEVEALVANAANNQTEGQAAGQDADNKNAEDVQEDVQENVQAAIDAERKRIQEIEAIAGSIPEDMVKEAKFEKPCDAKELAFRALVEDSKKSANYMQKAIEDSTNSGANDVVATPEGEKDSEADELASYVNKGKGGK